MECGLVHHQPNNVIRWNVGCGREIDENSFHDDATRRITNQHAIAHKRKVDVGVWREVGRHEAFAIFGAYIDRHDASVAPQREAGLLAFANFGELEFADVLGTVAILVDDAIAFMWFNNACPGDGVRDLWRSSSTT